MTHRPYIKYAVLGILSLLLVVRVSKLSNDPPLFYLGHGEALLTDPYHLTFSARSAIHFDD